jgi:hypothetical protein
MFGFLNVKSVLKLKRLLKLIKKYVRIKTKGDKNIMKKIIFIFLILIALVGCERTPSSEQKSFIFHPPQWLLGKWIGLSDGIEHSFEFVGNDIKKDHFSLKSVLWEESVISSNEYSIVHNSFWHYYYYNFKKINDRILIYKGILEDTNGNRTENIVLIKIN